MQPSPPMDNFSIYNLKWSYGYYSNGCNGSLRFRLPEGYTVRVYGTSDSEGPDHLYIYDNETVAVNKSGKGQTIDYTSTSSDVRIKFTSDGSVVYAGFDLTVDFIKVSSQ